MPNVFIIGSKGIPAHYGGFETFVHKLTEKKEKERIKYYVSCLSDNNSEFGCNNAFCFNVKTPKIGSARAVLYDLISLKRCISLIKKNNLSNCIIYILACRIGPFLPLFKRTLRERNIKLYVNPDGHEWKRSKWNKLIKAYWKLSEKFTVKHADLLICDSKCIESYIKTEYKKYDPQTTFISYGADIDKPICTNISEKTFSWYDKHNIFSNNYYLIVGRFVPENNYELMIKEFMQSSSDKDLVIITNVEKNKFYMELLNKTRFDKDKRIKFVGTVYDQQLLKEIRQNAFAYIHGHEVGGTNPSLLEALVSTKLNLLLDVEFNKEVGKDGALYFSKKEKSLAELINKVETYSNEKINSLESRAKKRIYGHYTWEKIVSSYEKLFLVG